MELFMGQAGLRIIRSPARLSRSLAGLPFPIVGCDRRLCLPEESKLGVTIYETHNRLPFCQVSKIERFDEHNLCSIYVNHIPLQRRLYSGQPGKDCIASPAVVPKSTIFQKMKQMTKDYWHVLIPVHVVTSIGWILIFYTAAKNSVDVIWIMEKLHFSEKYIEALRGSSAGFWAVAYALYKIFTPLRYMVTVGGTTLSIKYLNRLGYLKQKTLTASMQKSQQADQKIKLGKQAEPPKT